jgi:type I restriction enzyme, S subunit
MISRRTWGALVMSCEGWQSTIIGQIGLVVGGGTPSTKNPEYYDGDIPWITPKDLSDQKTKYIWQGSRSITKQGLNSSSARILPAGAILLSSRAPIGYVAIAKQAMCTNQGFKSIVPDNTICINEFVYYWLINNKDLLISNASGTTFLEISGGVLKNIEISLPPLPEQRAIARILSSLDDKIELNNRMNKTLEEIAQTLFKRWFVDFEFPDENGNPYKSSGGKMVESELGMIPEGWRVCPLSDVVDVLSGGTPSTKTEEYWNGDIPFFTPKDCSTDLFSVKTEKNITRLGLEKCNSKLYPKNMIFITARGTVGKTCLAGLPMAMNQSCFALKSKSSVSQQAMLLFIRNVIDQINSSASGAVFDAINIATFSFIKLIFPSNDQYTSQFDRIICIITDQILSLINQNQNLSQIRDTLLLKLMSGEIRVPITEE